MALKLSRPLSPGWVRRDTHSRYREKLSLGRSRSSPASLKPAVKTPKKRINVVWFKSTDLRTHDHAGLQAACAQEVPSLNLYIFDPFWFGKTRDFGFPKTGSVRARFLRESVDDLGTQLRARGSDLCVRHGDSAQIFRELLEEFEVLSVFAFHEVCAEELRIQAMVRRVLAEQRPQATLTLFWGFEMYHYEDLQCLKRRNFPKTYSAFRRAAEESNVRPCLEEPAVARCRNITVCWARAQAIPSLEDLGLKDPGPIDARAEQGLWTGGETAALARVNEYIWLTDSLANHYVGATMTTDPAKSCMRDKAFFKISPWLAHGCISPRYIYQEVKRYEQERRKTKSTGWILHELIWRDFVRFGARHHGSSIFKIGGMEDLHPKWEWSWDAERFQKWKEGHTGIPFIDVFMRELATTGYCNHMGRETAGWFLVADLGLDWRMGAEWFESMLIDFEPAANWFNWAYRCLPACVAKPLPPMSRLQTVEALKWCAQHDPDATYIKRWIPELGPLPAEIAREPWRLELSGAGVEEARGRSGGVLDGRIGEIGSAVPSAVTTPGAERTDQPGRNGNPPGRFTISRRDLQEVMALGFAELDAAIVLKNRSVTDAVAFLMAQNPQRCGGCGFLKDEGAADPSAWHNWYCYHCWQDYGGMPGDGTEDKEDADLQAALQMSMGQEVKSSSAGEVKSSSAGDEEDVEDAMLAEAMRLSLQESTSDKGMQQTSDVVDLTDGKDLEKRTPNTSTPHAGAKHSFGDFVLGESYPYPMLEPVCLRGTETVANEARQAQQQRDSMILKSEARNRAVNGRSNTKQNRPDVDKDHAGNAASHPGSSQSRPNVDASGASGYGGAATSVVNAEPAAPKSGAKRNRWGRGG